MFEYCCRVCLETDLYDTFIDIFWYGDDNETIADKLKCCGIEPLPNDDLPQIICQVCLEELTAAWNLRKRCLNTDILLRIVIKDDDECEDTTMWDLELSEVFGNKNSCEDTDSAEEAERSIKNRTLENSSEDDYWAEPAPVKKQQAVQDTVCIFCDEVLENCFSKNAHLRAQHPDELFCNVCNKSKHSVINTAQCLWRHKLGIRPSFLCQVCGRVFKKKACLEIHMRAMHLGQINYLCDLCGMSTKHKANLLRHFKNYHLSIRKYPCPHDSCPGISYTTKQSLNTHLYSHHNVTAPVSCDMCGGGFNFVSELRTHMPKCKNSQVRRKPSCPQNDIEELFKDVLEKTCTICNKEFEASAIYRRHMRFAHKQKLEYRCPHEGCGKTFSIRRSLVDHFSSHTGEKPFSCTVCSFKAATQQTVNKHIRKNHAPKKDSKKKKTKKMKILKVEQIPPQFD